MDFESKFDTYLSWTCITVCAERLSEHTGTDCDTCGLRVMRTLLDDQISSWLRDRRTAADLDQPTHPGEGRARL